MRVFQEEIFGPVLSVTSFDGYDDAIRIANDTLYGLGAGVWSRDITTAYRAGRDIQAGRVWTNTYHQYPAHASADHARGGDAAAADAGAARCPDAAPVRWVL